MHSNVFGICMGSSNRTALFGHACLPQELRDKALLPTEIVQSVSFDVMIISGSEIVHLFEFWICNCIWNVNFAIHNRSCQLFHKSLPHELTPPHHHQSHSVSKGCHDVLSCKLCNLGQNMSLAPNHKCQCCHDVFVMQALPYRSLEFNWQSCCQSSCHDVLSCKLCCIGLH